MLEKSDSSLIDRTLSPDFRVEHRMRRGLFEKRIVALEQSRFVLYRFVSPAFAKRLVWLLEQGESFGIPLQRHVAQTADWSDALRQRGWWVAATYEAGEPLMGAGSPESLAALGRTLAALHRMERSQPGPLFKVMPPTFGYARRLSRDLHCALAIVCSKESERRGYREWLAVNGAFINDLSTYQLTHGDLYGRNILVRADGICLIDYELAEFEPAGLELGTALLRSFCGESAELRESLLRAYMDACPAALAKIWEAHSAFFLVVAALRLVKKREFRARRLAKLGQPNDAVWAQVSCYGEWARTMMRAHQAGVTSLEALLGLCRT